MGLLAVLNLKQIAIALGVTHTAPYRHFKDKQALLDEVAKVGFAQLTEHMQRAYEHKPAGTREQFLATGYAVIEFALQQPGYYRAMFFGHRGGTLRELANPPPASAFDVFLGYIAAWQQSRVLRPGAALPLALAIWSTTHGLACLCMSGQIRMRTRADLRKLADAAHTSLLDGVGR